MFFKLNVNSNILTYNLDIIVNFTQYIFFPVEARKWVITNIKQKCWTLWFKSTETELVINMLKLREVYISWTYLV